MRKSTLVTIVFIFCTLILGCKRTVKRISPDQQIDLSGRWNDVDSKLVAQEMIKDVMSRPWHNNFFQIKRQSSFQLKLLLKI